MTPRKRVKNDRPYPDDWTVRYEWEFAKGRKSATLASRRHDVRVGQTWFMFERHVTTPKTEWLDLFELYPYGGFKAVRPSEVSAFRMHVEPKKKPEKSK